MITMLKPESINSKIALGWSSFYCRGLNQNYPEPIGQMKFIILIIVFIRTQLVILLSLETKELEEIAKEE